MRKLLILAVALAACSKSETPAADTTAAAAPAPAMAMATPLAAADVDGKWIGVSHPETGDSVLGKWTVEGTGNTGKLTFDGAKESIPFTRMIDADSMVTTSSAPFADPANPKGGKVNFRAVGHLKDGKLMGTASNTLASKPDSVVSRIRWEATKAP